MMNQQSQNLYSQQPQMDSKFQYTDEELILRFQEGDEQAYIELVKRYKDKLINFVYRLVSCLLYTSPSPRDATLSRMPSSA